ncbi:siderophore-interacting protein [Scrofimicrobium sp. R131]|uniref:Siderophore-interacting protein n=1 Tax=Scrofimicrobium appendicitidis TaxID=3079930 RepID=A0AAU7V905_9ACTO
MSEEGGDTMVNLVAEKTRVYPPFRPYRAQVIANEQLSASFRRLTFTGDLLDRFSTDGFDQRVKLVLPAPGEALPELGQDDDWAPESFSWHHRWRELDHCDRFPIRTYTVAEADPVARTVTIDFVIHEGGGPGSSFAERAQPGDEIILAGPDSYSEHGPMGVDYQPGSARRILLVADETALPAVRSILRQSPRDVQVSALIELPTVADALDLQACGHRVELVLRGQERGCELIRAVDRWCDQNLSELRRSDDTHLAPIDINREVLWETASEVESFYAWLAGEAGVIKELRRRLVKERQVDRRQVSFMGYWREGHVI